MFSDAPIAPLNEEKHKFGFVFLVVHTVRKGEARVANLPLDRSAQQLKPLFGPFPRALKHLSPDLERSARNSLILHPLGLDSQVAPTILISHDDEFQSC